MIIEAGDDRSAVLAGERDTFDALVFSRVLMYIADPIALFAELAPYRVPRRTEEGNLS